MRHLRLGTDISACGVIDRTLCGPLTFHWQSCPHMTWQDEEGGCSEEPGAHLQVPAWSWLPVPASNTADLPPCIPC